jgi:two-component system, response regulator PdtaR
MTGPLRIVVADDEPRMHDYYRDVLPLMGHRVTAAAENGRELLRYCRVSRPDLIITDIKMPELDGLEAAEQVGRAEPIPVILVSAYHDPDLFARARGINVLAYLVKPIKQADLEAAIAIVMQRFEQLQALRREAGELRQALEDRKLIERAKGVLMKKAALDEPEAFRRLQKLARDNNQKLVEVAQMIIRAEAAFQPPER